MVECTFTRINISDHPRWIGDNILLTSDADWIDCSDDVFVQTDIEELAGLARRQSYSNIGIPGNYCMKCLRRSDWPQFVVFFSHILS